MPRPCVVRPLFLSVALVSASGSAAEAPPPPPAPVIPVPQGPPAAPPAELHGLTVSELVIRVKESSEILVVKSGIKQDILEELRRAGLKVFGGESLVFNRDDSSKARFALGGTLDELDCAGWFRASCRIGIAWELLDREADNVVYRVRTRAVGRHVAADGQWLRTLIVEATRSLLTHPHLRDAVTKRAEPSAAGPSYAVATLKTCPTKELKMPRASNQAIDATVMLESGNQFGSGVVISPDGLLLTASHVVGPEMKATFKDGRKVPATLIRRDPRHDIALLKLDLTGVACLRPRAQAADVGESLFAIGAPAAKDLAFSVTKGIVSGLREWSGTSFIQTDASINPGNSGGPLLDDLGQLVGVVSWKVTGIGVEGVAFGVPAAPALQALGLVEGPTTDETLTRAMPVEVTKPPQAIEDAADPIASLNPEADLRRAQRERFPATYRAVSVLRWGGLTLTLAGALGVLGSWIDALGPRTAAAFRTDRVVNDVSWACVAVGAVGFATSFILPALLPKSPAAATGAQVSLMLGPQGVGFGLSYTGVLP